MKVRKLHTNNEPPYDPIYVKPDDAGVSAIIDIPAMIETICDELAEAVKTYIKISKYEYVRDYHKDEAVERALHYLSRITRILKYHAIFEDLEVLALLKKHKRQWDIYLKEIEEEREADRETMQNVIEKPMS